VQRAQRHVQCTQETCELGVITCNANTHFPRARGRNRDCGHIQGLLRAPGHGSFALDWLAGSLWGGPAGVVISASGVNKLAW